MKTDIFDVAYERVDFGLLRFHFDKKALQSTYTNQIDVFIIIDSTF
jgi:hypothetical protein